jgi:hypothetical protein
MNFKKYFYSTFVFFALVGMGACVSLQQQIGGQGKDFSYKKFVLDNKIYEDSIRTVLFYPQIGTDNQTLEPAVMPLGQSAQFALEFDELKTKYANYYFKIIHCNADWQKSNLTDFEIIQEFNELRITDYQFSFNTKVPYIHYKALLPRVKISGNFVVKVYRENNENDVVLSCRFMIYDNSVSIAPKVGFSQVPSERFTHQQIDFFVSYKNYDLVNPRDEVKAVIRQNFRWDKMISNYKALYVNELEKRLEFTSFTGENAFKGLNEYRFFQMVSRQFSGMNIDKIDLSQVPISISLTPEKTRQRLAYARLQDINGNFSIQNYETTNGNTDSDYLRVLFTLISPATEGNVFVMGKFNDWQANEENQMFYDTQKQAYQAQILLKQGIYNYSYATQIGTKLPDESLWEGSHQPTENMYEIFLYYRPLGSRYDHLIGYSLVKAN